MPVDEAEHHTLVGLFCVQIVFLRDRIAGVI
jgi:hypothetical protein